MPMTILARRLLREKHERRLRRDVENRLLLRSVHDAFRAGLAASADGYQGAEEENVVGAHRVDCSENFLWWSGYRDDVPFADLPARHPIIQPGRVRGNGVFADRQEQRHQDEKKAARGYHCRDPPRPNLQEPQWPEKRDQAGQE